MQHAQEERPVERHVLRVIAAGQARLEAGLTCRYDAQDMPLDWPLFLRMLHEAMGGIRGRFFALDRFPLADATASVRQP